MGVPVSEDEQTCARTTKMADNDSDFLEFPRKKKMFSSSSFYEEPNAIYPTVEEQVEMCRKIADSLSDDCNKKSRGANMFFKRVKRAEKWVVDSTQFHDEEIQVETNTDLSKLPYVRVSKNPPKLKLILDPRHIVDMQRLKQEGINIVEHNAVSPEICHDLVKDLNSPTGRGAMLFAKRKKKAEEWVVDEEKVKALLRERQDRDSCFSPEPSTLPTKPLTHPRVQMIKTPWNAAMESPIGSCEGAFRDVISSNEVAESVIKAAESKVMTYPSARLSVLDTVASQTENAAPQQAASRLPNMSSPVPAFANYRTNIYMSRAPKGWMGSFTNNVTKDDSQNLKETESSTQASTLPDLNATKLPRNFPVSRSLTFADFNSRPKAWSADAQTFTSKVKPVRPPSVLVQ